MIMPTDDTGMKNRVHRTESRRRFLGAAVAAAVGTAAGCSSSGELTSLEFEASPVVLPEDGREEFVVAEGVRGSNTETIEPNAAGVEAEVSVTSHVATYRRSPARGRPTLIEGFLGEVNGTEGAGPTVVTPASALGLDVVTLGFLEGAPEVPAASIGLTVPGAGIDGDSIDPGAIMARIVTDDISGGDWAPGGRWRPGSNWFPGSRWIPDKQWVPRRSWEPGSDWVPGREWLAGSQWEEDGGATEMLVTTGERSFESVFGRSVEDDDGRPFEDGETITTRSPLIAAPVGDGAFPEVEAALRSPQFEPGDLFDAAVPAPLSGATFGLGVLSTPRAEVAGEARNPWATEDLATLLERGETRELLEGVGLSDADNIRWLAGPKEVSQADASVDPSLTEILDTAGVEPRTFTGIVNSREGIEVNWLVVLHVARVESDGDAVVASGGHRTWIREDATGSMSTDDMLSWVTSGAQMSAACFDRLARREE